MLAAVRPRAWVGHTPGAPALGRVLRPQCVAGRPLFPGVSGAFNPVRHRLPHAGEYLREVAPSSANHVAGREHDRARGRVRCGCLRVKGVVTCLRGLFRKGRTPSRLTRQ